MEANPLLFNETLGISPATSIEVAELIPEATTGEKGLMSANDKKYSPYVFDSSANLLQIAKMDLNVNWARSQVFICGNLSDSIIFGTLNVNTNDDKDLHIGFKFISYDRRVKFYKKNDAFFMKANTGTNPFTGFIWSTTEVKNTGLSNVDDTYTEITVQQ